MPETTLAEVMAELAALRTTRTTPPNDHSLIDRSGGLDGEEARIFLVLLCSGGLPLQRCRDGSVRVLVAVSPLIHSFDGSAVPAGVRVARPGGLLAAYPPVAQRKSQVLARSPARPSRAPRRRPKPPAAARRARPARPASGMPGAAAGKKGEEDKEWKRPAYIVDSDPNATCGLNIETDENGNKIAPPVIG